MPSEAPPHRPCAAWNCRSLDGLMAGIRTGRHASRSPKHKRPQRGIGVTPRPPTLGGFAPGWWFGGFDREHRFDVSRRQRFQSESRNFSRVSGSRQSDGRQSDQAPSNLRTARPWPPVDRRARRGRRLGIQWADGRAPEHLAAAHSKDGFDRVRRQRNCLHGSEPLGDRGSTRSRDPAVYSRALHAGGAERAIEAGMPHRLAQG
jgi:hypothetical protein